MVLIISSYGHHPVVRAARLSNFVITGQAVAVLPEAQKP